jgi:tRNA nucleotidyltransferase (CCA-adding enzyme)
MNSMITCAIMQTRLTRVKRKMPRITNLAGEIEKQLPTELVEFMQAGGLVAANQGQSLYLVGGVVRDLLLKRTNLDLDLVVEGDAINLARQLADIVQAKLVTHPRFNTAKLRWDKWSVDLTSARSEIYDKPGALPRVTLGSLWQDLFRRDFTINAMAVSLAPDRYGELVDLYGGRSDLEHKRIRILRNNSFIDDATRIWRGLRYEQRLDFQLEKDTLKLLKRNLSMLDTISGDRMRHELELILREEFPEKALCRAYKLRVLSKLHPALKADDWLADKFEWARQLSSPDSPPVAIYLALLAYRLTAERNEQLILRLNLPKTLAKALRDTISLKAQLGLLDSPGLINSSVYHLLHGYSLQAVTANLLVCDSLVACHRIQLFLNKLRRVRPLLTGKDLVRMGIAPGPRVKDLLRLLRDARLNGRITTREGEEAIARSWVE